MDQLLENVIAVTKQAGDIIMGFYRDSYTVTDKSPDNPVTDADFAADKHLKNKLLKLLPDAGWLSEETVDSVARLNKRFCWIVDPLDGTKEFVLGIPEFTISVALVQESRPILGVVYNPPTGELFSGEKGKGVYFGKTRTSVSSIDKLSDAKVDASRSERNRGEFEPFEELFKIQTMGSIAYKLARVSAGLTDATWSLGPKNEWDICAGSFLVEEAGGISRNLDNDHFHFNQADPKVNGIIVSNEKLYKRIFSTLSPYRNKARTN